MCPPGALHPAAPVHDTPEPEPRHRGRKILKWVGIALAALLLVIAAVLLLLNTGPGKRFIIGQLEGMEFENGMEIGIGAIEELLPHCTRFLLWAASWFCG